MPSLIGRCGGGGGGLVPQYGLYTSNDQSMAAGATATMEWVYSTGDHVLDLTDPFNPHPATNGVYFVSCICTSGTLGWTAGHALIAQIDAVNSVFPINGIGDLFPNFAGNLGAITVQTLSPMTTADYFQLLLQNGDVGARVMRASPMAVVRIGAT